MDQRGASGGEGDQPAGLWVDIRPLRPDELDAVDQHLPSADPDMHARRLDDQESESASYFVAWLGARPVGHALIRWGGTGNPSLASRADAPAAHPYLEGLAVHPLYQSRGIGTQILGAAEDAAMRRACIEIGLAVAVDNVRARALYGRLGYRETGVGEFASIWSYVDETGCRRVEVETCIYLVKSLAGNATPAHGALGDRRSLRDGMPGK